MNDKNQLNNFQCKGFRLHLDHKSVWQKMSNEKAGILIKAIFQYKTTGVITVNLEEYGLDLIMEMIICQLKKDDEISRSKEYHWNWKGGVTSVNKAIRNSPDYRHWREMVFRRDCYTCQFCHKHGIKLHAHHIKSFAEYPEFRFEVNNGVTLCESCHYKEHSNG